MRIGRKIGFILVGCVVLGIPARGLAQEHGKEHKKEPLKVNVDYESDTKHIHETLDLTKKADLDKFLSLVEKEHIHEIELDKPPNPMAIYADLALWTVVVFLLLYFILKKKAWGPILEGLQKREDNIREAAEEAKRAREETQKVAAEYKAKMDAAYAEIPKLMDQARKDAQALADELRAKAQADIQADRQRSLREIDMSKDQAMQEITKYAANLATLISAKAIHRSLSLEDHQALVEESIGELAQAEKKVEPNKGALTLYENQSFQSKVQNGAVECTEVAYLLQVASGSVGVQLTINPPPGRRFVRWPTKQGPERGNYHTVYSDGSFVFDPRYRDTPIPLAEWRAEVNMP